MSTMFKQLNQFKAASSFSFSAAAFCRSVVVGASILLAACSGDSSPTAVQNVNNEDNAISDRIIYDGPAPATDEVRRFKDQVWDNLAINGRCVDCHSDVTDNQAPLFMRADDINQAYQEALALISRDDIETSRLVTKVGTPHNCWRGNNNAGLCTDLMTGYIESWLNADASTNTEIQLEAPEIREIGRSKSFPSAPDNFKTFVYDEITERYCAECHAENVAQRQQPYIGSGDIDVAYQAAKNLMNLDDPSNSTMVLRVGQELHGCWSDCGSNAQEIAAQIAAFANTIEVSAVDPALVTSKALNFVDGISASSGGRVESNIIALYDFKTGEGSTVFDVSGVDPALDLNITGDVEWLGSFGLKINNGKAQGATATSKKLRDMIARASQAFSIEAWVVPENVSQDGPARIVSFSGNSDERNFTLGQTLYNYNLLTRHEGSDANGMPGLSTPDADEVLQATLQHVVATFDPIDGRKIYVNGELVAQDDSVGNLNDWSESFAVVLGNETDNQQLWKGIFRLVAIHNTALTEEDVQANFDVGVGQRFFLLFNVSERVSMPDAYVVFQIEQFDSYSYLFSEPFFISLDEEARPQSDILIQGIRIGINGREAPLGQAFANTNVTINSSNYETTGVSLSSIGAIVPLDRGSEQDEFFLTFDRIDSASFTRPPEEGAITIPAVLSDEQPRLAVKNFAEVNASLSAITKVNQTVVAETYNIVKQQLPVSEDLEGFLASHQAGVMQMAVAYCTALVNRESTQSTGYFADFNFSAPASTAFNGANADKVISPLLDGMNALDNTVITQPVSEDIALELRNLIDAMSGADTKTIVSSVCAAAGGSAMMLLQ